MPTPEGADERIFRELKDALERAIIDREADKFISKPPTVDEKNEISLTVDRNGLSWDEARWGDWNNDGAVSAQDLSPLALNFGRNGISGDPDYYKYALEIDGNGDGLVDAGDLNPIALHFGESTGGYFIYQADDSSGTGEIKVAEISRPEIPPDSENPPTLTSFAELHYDSSSGSVNPAGWTPTRGKWYRVAPFDATVLKEPSSDVSSSWAELPTNKPPVAVANANPDTGEAPLTVNFSASGSYDPDDSIVLYEWDFEGDEVFDYSDPTNGVTQHTYITPATYDATLRVTDNDGATGSGVIRLIVSPRTGPGRGDWWMSGREPTHNRRSPFLGPQTAPLGWRFETGGYVGSSVMGSDGTVFVGSGDGSLYAINPDGTLKWRYQTGASISSPAVGLDGTIYFGSGDSYLYAVDAEGSLKWRYKTDSVEACSPVIGTDETIYVGSTDTYLYAINPDGTLKWRFQTNGLIFSSPAIADDGTIYICSRDYSYLYAITGDGKLKWNLDAPFVYGEPAIGSDGTIYVPTYANYFFAFTPGGVMKWLYVAGFFGASSPAIGSDGTIYFGSTNHFLEALNPDGTVKWQFDPGSSALSSGPAIGSDGTIYVAGSGGSFYAVSPEGTLKWNYSINGDFSSSPAIGADGTIYIGSNNGYLHALGVTPGNQPPFAVASAVDRSGPPPFTAKFSASGSYDPDGTIALYEWDFNDDGTYDYGNPGTGDVDYTYILEGQYRARLRVTDNNGATDTNSVYIIVSVGSNQPPVAVASGNPLYGSPPLTVSFSAIDSYDEDGTIALYEWDFTADGSYDWSDSNTGDTQYTYETGDTYTAVLRVTDNLGRSATDIIVINAGPGDWWMFGREPTHNRRSPYLGSQTGTLRWRSEEGGLFYSSPSIGSDGTIFLGHFFYGYGLYAVAPDGTLKWEYGASIAYSSPAIGSDGTVYIGSDGGYLYALNPDGTLKWRYQTGDEVWSSPAIGPDGAIYVGSSDDYLYAVNPDGTLRWRYQTGNNVLSSPAIGPDGTIYVGSYDGYLYAINPDATLKWRYQTNGLIFSSPAVADDGTIYVGSDDFNFYAINGDGSLKWRYQTGDRIASSPAIASDGTIFFGSRDRYVYALRPDGTLMWRYDTGYGVWSSPAIGSDGTVYVGSDDGYLYALNPDGTLKWSYGDRPPGGDAVQSSPAIGPDGTVYFVGLLSGLYAIGD